MNKPAPHHLLHLRPAFQKILLCMTLLPVASAIHAQAPSRTDLPAGAFSVALDQELPVNPQVIVGEFDNGLRYYIRENAEPANRAELRLVVDVGSVLEDDDQVGLAHFLEHMAFNGTEHFEKQELIGFMESIGMRMGPGINASTSFDETIYQLQLPTENPDYMETAFRIMEDWATGMTLDSEEIDLERGVVIEEWRLGQGAQSRIRDQQIPVLLKDSRYATRLPIGTLENLQNFDADTLRSFYKDWYRPELMAVIAVGDFRAEDIEALMQEYFEAIPASENQRERTRFTVPEHSDTLYTIVTDAELPITQVTVYQKFPVEDDWTAGAYRQRLVESLYTGMFSTRLQELTREANPPFLAAGAGKSGLVRPYSAWVLTAVVPETAINRGLETLFVEAERVARFGFSEDELNRQKAVLLRASEQLYASRDNHTSGSLAAEMIRSYLTGESIPGAEYETALYQRFVPEITLDEVNQLGRNWGDLSNTVVSLTAPEKTGFVPPTAEELGAVIASSASLNITAREETASEEELVPVIPQGSKVVETRNLDGGLTEWILGNGVRVILKPTDFKQDEIVFAAYSPGGTSLSSDADFIPADTAVTVIANGGLGNFTAVELQRKLSGKLANVVPVISDYEEGLRGNGSPEDLETLMQLIYLRITAPRADTTFFDIFKTQSTAVLQNRSANPAVEFDDTFRRLLFQDHERRQPPSVEMIDETDLARSLAFYEDRFADVSDFTFVFAGNIDLEKMQPLVETYIGGLPGNDRQESWKDQNIRYASGVTRETVHRGLEPQSRTRIAFTGTLDIRDSFARTRMVAATQWLQTRLRNVMREQLGGTYNVQVNPQMNWVPVESYVVTIEFASDPARADEMSQTLFSEIAALQDNPPTATEFEEIRQFFLRSYETSVEQNSFWVSQLIQAVSMGTEPLAKNILMQPEVVESLTPENIQETAVAILDMDNYVQVTLMPEN